MIKCALLAGLVATAALAASVSPALAAPFLSIESPGAGTVTNQTHPTISGFTSDSEDAVTVVVRKEGLVYEEASAAPSGNQWSVELPTHLEDGEYTVVAEQTEPLTEARGASESVGFTVDTKSPTVTLNGIPSPTNDSTPSFSGTASDSTDVTVYVHRGSSAGGSIATAVSASVSGGAWSSASVSSLADGTYTAIAEQPSSIGNEAGFSEPTTFEVHASKPKVTLNGISSPTGDRTPSFSGTASEHTAVTVRVYEGSAATGTPVAEVGASGTGGSWSSGDVPAPLHDGTYTAIAEQQSEFEDGPGTSNTIGFTVSTPAPSVSLEHIPSPSNDTTPSFSGFAGEGTPVTVNVYAGGVAKGEPVGAAHASGTGGTWSSGPVAPALGEGSYTAVAEQTGAFDNGTGHSGEVHFTIVTSSPEVVLTPFKSPSNVRAPSFSGTTNDSDEVLVQVLEAGHPVWSSKVKPSGGKWKAGPVSPELPAGEHSYTVVATQSSSLGNPPGKSAELPYVLDTLPPAVTINEIATPSNNTEPTFTGTATDSGPVKVVVKPLAGGKQFEASGPAGTCATPPATPTTCWTVGPIKLPSTKAPYTAEAIQQSSLGNPAGVSKPPIKFLVDPGAPSVTMSALPEQIDTQTPTFTGTAGDTTPVFVSICKVSNPHCEAQHGEGEEPESGGGGFWSATEATPLEDGEYHAIAWQESRAGAVGATEKQTFTVDTLPPAVTIVTPAQGATVSGATVSFHGAAGTAPHDKPQVTVQLFAGGSASGPAVGTPLAVTATGGEWSAELGGLAPGEYTVRASQRDAAGNTGVSEHSFHDIAIAAPTVGPAASFSWFPAHPHTGEPVTLVSTSGDATSPITSYAWDVLGSAFIPGAQRKTTTFTTPGSHLVRLRVTDGAGLSGLASQQISVSFPLMRPFPTVRIVATRSRGHLRLKALTVEAPAGATVTVTCKGKGCPVRSLSRLVQRPKGKPSGLPVLTFPRLQRGLPAGVALEIRVTQPGKVGKFTRFAVRKGRLPLRSDACVNGTEPKPVPCTG